MSCLLSGVGLFAVFFFKQKTAYDMRISDWSSDVCSSDLTVLATAARLHDQRASGQGGLFGGEGAVEEAEIRPLATARWTLAERMEQEKEAFGFYFSAHPVDRHRLLAKMHGARDYAALGELPIAEGQRTGATMAARVEEARWRKIGRATWREREGQ